MCWNERMNAQLHFGDMTAFRSPNFIFESFSFYFFCPVFHCNFKSLFFLYSPFAKIFFLSHFHSFTFSCLIHQVRKYMFVIFFVALFFHSFELSRTKGTKAMKNRMLHFEWGYITSHNFKRDRCFDLFHFSFSLSPSL